KDLGNALEDLFNSQDLADLVEPTASSDPEAARHQVDDDKASAAIIIPEGFTESIIPVEGAMPPALAPGASVDPSYVQPEPVQIEVYTNPSRPKGASVIKAIVDEFVSLVEDGRTSGMTSMVQLMSSGLLNPQNAESEARELFQNV